jgi:hypothetical protein
MTTTDERTRTTREDFVISEIIAHRVMRAERPCGCVGKDGEALATAYHSCKRPYSAWRAEEHAYWNLDAWSRLVSQWPAGGPKRTSREWSWGYAESGYRTELRPSGVVDIDPETNAPRMIIRDIGPHDSLGGARRPQVRRTVPSPLVHITFPEWVPAS